MMQRGLIGGALLIGERRAPPDAEPHQRQRAIQMILRVALFMRPRELLRAGVLARTQGQGAQVIRRERGEPFIHLVCRRLAVTGVEAAGVVEGGVVVRVVPGEAGPVAELME